MRKRRDPDRLDVRATRKDEVFISWLYDEGVSGTLSLTPKTALDLAIALKAAALSTVAHPEAILRGEEDGS